VKANINLITEDGLGVAYRKFYLGYDVSAR